MTGKRNAFLAFLFLHTYAKIIISVLKFKKGHAKAMRILIKNGHVLDPLTNTDTVCDVLVEDGEITKTGEIINVAADREIDAGNCYVMPGFIDLHVHLREPGLEYKETIATGGAAAAKGGVTTMCAMPNTRPVIDSGELVRAVHRKAQQESPVHIIQIGAVTLGQEGKELADIKGMAEAGCHAISEDGKSVMNADLYKQGMVEAARNNISVFAHCEDINLVRGGVMNADPRADQLGLKGITNEVEDIIVKRDIELAEATDVRLHLCHCSTEDSVRLLAEAKAKGLPVTGEVCPHHFILTTDDITEDDGNFKMNPPLRAKCDVEALKKGLKDGIMDVISTDHAPHAENEKNCSMKDAAFGIVGLETSAALTYTELVDKKVLTPLEMVEKMSYNPAEILGLNDRGSVSAGMRADLVIFDPHREYLIDKDGFASKGKNTPFHGRKVKGEVIYTIVDGRVVYEKNVH